MWHHRRLRYFDFQVADQETWQPGPFLSDAREFTQLGEGLPYGMSLHPNGRRVAYHLASPQGYQIWTSHVDGSKRVRVAAHPDHLYFGPQWSPDGAWLLFQDCHFRTDPGHDWSDLCRWRGNVRSKRTGMSTGATTGAPDRSDARLPARGRNRAAS